MNVILMKFLNNKKMWFNLILSFPQGSINWVGSQSSFIKLPKQFRPLTIKGGTFHKLTITSLLKTRLKQLIVYEKAKLVPARTLTLGFRCPSYGKMLCRLHKVQYIHGTKQKDFLIYLPIAWCPLHCMLHALLGLSGFKPNFIKDSHVLCKRILR